MKEPCGRCAVRRFGYWGRSGYDLEHLELTQGLNL